MQSKIITDITDEPLDATYLKNYINELETLSTADTTQLGTMIKAARELCEKYTNKAFAEKTYQVFVEEEEIADNDRYIELPFTPHSTVTSVTPYDYKGAAQTALVAGTGYCKTGLSRFELYIPTVVATVGESVLLSDYIIEYVCGYGISESTEGLPSGLKQIMATIISKWWGNRDNWIAVLDKEAKSALSVWEDIRL